MEQQLVEKIHLPDIDDQVKILTDIQSALKQEADIALLGRQRSDALFALKYPTFDQQKQLFDKHIEYLSNNFTPVGLIEEKYS